MSEGKKILVTGGCGFIGTNFVRHMLEAHPEFRIVNLDKLTYAGRRENLRDVEGQERYTFVRGDIADFKTVDAVMAGIDEVVHLAAETHVDRSIKDPADFVRTNVLGTYNLLECAMRHRVKRFVHISTDEVYGSLGTKGSFSEESLLAPNSPYAASKAGGDMLARSYVKTYGFPAVIARCSNNYGPYQHEEKFLPLIITNALRDQKLPVYGDGLNIRDWLYVEDHCRAIDLIRREGQVGEVYNIGGNNEWRNIDMAKLVLKELGKPESLIEFVEDRLGHDRRYAIDASKIRRELGWAPKTAFPDGLKMTLDFFRARSTAGGKG